MEIDERRRAGLAVDDRVVRTQANPPRGHFFDDARIQLVLDVEYTLCERFRRVVRVDRDWELRDDGSLILSLVHKMHSGPR